MLSTGLVLHFNHTLQIQLCRFRAKRKRDETTFNPILKIRRIGHDWTVINDDVSVSYTKVINQPTLP